MEERWRRSGPAQFSRKAEVYAALQRAVGTHCLVEEWALMDKNVEAEAHRSEWCSATRRYRCMRCGRNNKEMNMSGICEGPR